MNRELNGIPSTVGTILIKNSSYHLKKHRLAKKSITVNIKQIKTAFYQMQKLRLKEYENQAFVFKEF